MGALIPLALTLAPEIAQWLFGGGSETTLAAIGKAVEAATGTSDPEAATTVVQSSPAIAADLRVQLAQIAAERQAASRTADLNQLTATLRDTDDARMQTLSLTGQKTAIAWSAPVVSAVVLLTFGAIMTVVLLRGMPVGSETAVNMLLGTLAAMATSVVSYWVGSSAGSARKDERLAQAAK